MKNFNTYIAEKLKINKDIKVNSYKEKIINFLSRFEYFNDRIKNEYKLDFNSNEDGNEWYSFDWSKIKNGDNRVSVSEEMFVDQVIKKWKKELKDEFVEVTKSIINHRINFIIKL